MTWTSHPSGGKSTTVSVTWWRTRVGGVTTAGRLRLPCYRRRRFSSLDRLHGWVLSSVKELYPLPVKAGLKYLQTLWQCYGGRLRSVYHSYDTSAATVIHNSLTNQFSPIAESYTQALTDEYRRTPGCPRWVHQYMHPGPKTARILAHLHRQPLNEHHTIRTGLSGPFTGPTLQPENLSQQAGTLQIISTLITNLVIVYLPEKAHQPLHEYGVHHAFLMLTDDRQNTFVRQFGP